MSDTDELNEQLEAEEAGEVAQHATIDSASVDFAGDQKVENLNPLAELDERFDLKPLRFIRDDDGMPKHVTEDQPFVAPLALETLICLADTSKFCMRGPWGEIWAEFEPSEVERTPCGSWRVPTDLLLERIQLKIQKARKLFEKRAELLRTIDPGHAHILDSGDPLMILQTLLSQGSAMMSMRVSAEYIEVFPIRPQCSHYAAQISEITDLPGREGLWRLCTARRDTAGAFVTVRDLKITACTMRSPHDEASAAKIAEFDRKKIAEGKNRVLLPLFQDLDPADAPTGIFGTPATDGGAEVIELDDEELAKHRAAAREAAKERARQSQTDGKPYFAPPALDEEAAPQKEPA